jgi:N-acetyl-gamma-glutamyl-phosphate reductase
MARVYIDGQAGTTGLEITERLKRREDIDLLEIEPAQRKNPDARKELLKAADVAILCLPDDAAREACALAEGQTKILDASTAHRVDPDWVYGLPEMASDQRNRIANAQFVSNPGCYPQGFILAIRPLIEAQAISPDLGLTMHALSGYSGGGRQMIEAYRNRAADECERYAATPYALGLQHKHVPEMTLFSKTSTAPVFSPVVAAYYKGMITQIPLFTRDMSGQPDAQAIARLLIDRYADERFIRVLPVDADRDGGYLNPTACNDTNRLEIMVAGNGEHVMLSARYDNLGKGASGAAIQNLNLMIGADETLGLSA